MDKFKRKKQKRYFTCDHPFRKKRKKDTKKYISKQCPSGYIFFSFSSFAYLFIQEQYNINVYFFYALMLF